MRILLTGTSGQVGRELKRGLSVLGEVRAPSSAEFDLARPDTLATLLDQWRPQLIVNPAAYTAVDRAETTERDLAMKVNRDGPAALARWCAANDVALVHYSTDYVYPGEGDSAFTEASPTGPHNHYGASKLAGDQAVASSGCVHLILRTSWVYAATGRNFLTTMLRLADDRPTLSVVDDQIGAPTSARLIADVTIALLARHGMQAEALRPHAGVCHLTAGGSVSWHGFATEIMRLRHAATGKPSPEVKAIPTSEFPTPAVRPPNSRLALDRLRDRFGIVVPDWRIVLRDVMEQRTQA